MFIYDMYHKIYLPGVLLWAGEVDPAPQSVGVHEEEMPQQVQGKTKASSSARNLRKALQVNCFSISHQILHRWFVSWNCQFIWESCRFSVKVFLEHRNATASHCHIDKAIKCPITSCQKIVFQVFWEAQPDLLWLDQQLWLWLDLQTQAASEDRRWWYLRVYFLSMVYHFLVF